MTTVIQGWNRMVMKRILLATTAALALLVSGQQPPRPSLFTDEERQAIVQFWSESGRYVAHLPADAEKNGPFQVRLTVAGSSWIREYNRLRGLAKVPPRSE